MVLKSVLLLAATSTTAQVSLDYSKSITVSRTAAVSALLVKLNHFGIKIAGHNHIACYLRLLQCVVLIEKGIPMPIRIGIIATISRIVEI